jgi:hypothetical protein
VPRKTSELGACKDLEGHIFTICSGNKGKDGDMLHMFKEKMITCIGTKYGDNVAQEWTSKNALCLWSLPTNQQLRQGMQKEYGQPESNSIKK